MKLAGFNEECSWLRLFARFHFWKSRNCRNATKKFFCLSLYFKIRKFIFRQSESCVLTMSNCSRRVNICGLKSSIEVQQPTVSGNMKKMFYSCLCTSFRICCCVLTEKIDKTAVLWLSITFPVSESDHFSSLTETRMCGLADCCKPLCLNCTDLRHGWAILAHWWPQTLRRGVPGELPTSGKFSELFFYMFWDMNLKSGIHIR